MHLQLSEMKLLQVQPLQQAQVGGPIEALNGRSGWPLQAETWCLLQLADCLVLLPRLEVEILSKASRRLETNFYVVMAPLKILLVGPKEAGKSTVRCCLRSLARLR